MKRYYIARSSFFIFFAWLVPNIVSFLAVPYIVGKLGYDEYGLWSLIVATIGCFAILDMNLVKGGIRYLAEYHAKGDTESANQVITFGVLIYLGIGITGMVLILLFTKFFLLSVLTIPPELASLARLIFQLSAFGFLVNMVLSYLASLPKAVHRFDINTKIEIFYNVSLTLFTVLVLYLGYGLVAMILVRIIGNIFNSATYYITIRKLLPYFRLRISIKKDLVRKLMSFSLYTFISRIGTSTSSQLTTLVVGSVLGTAAVTIYSVPYIAATRIMGLSYKLCNIIFPLSSELGSTGQIDKLHNIYIRFSRYLFFLNAFITLVFCIFSFDILSVWMGNEFAQRAHIILMLIAIAVFFDILTSAPSLVNDGLNYPQVTSVFAVGRGIIGIVAVSVGAKLNGVLGVAWAFALSSILGSVLFNLYVHKYTIRLPFLRLVEEAYLKTFAFSATIFFAAYMIRHSIQGLNLRDPYSLALKLFLFGAIQLMFGYFFVLDPEMKQKIIMPFIRKSKCS